MTTTTTTKCVLHQYALKQASLPNVHMLTEHMQNIRVSSIWPNSRSIGGADTRRAEQSLINYNVRNMQPGQIVACSINAFEYEHISRTTQCQHDHHSCANRWPRMKIRRSNLWVRTTENQLYSPLLWWSSLRRRWWWLCGVYSNLGEKFASSKQ